MAKKATAQYKQVKNARRQANTRIKRLTKDLHAATSAKAKENITRKIEQFRDALESVRTYSSVTGKRVRTSTQVAENLKELQRLNFNENARIRGNKAANKATEIEINKASVVASSIYKESQVHIFYRMTQKYWQNSKIENRNDAIMAAKGKYNLANLFEEITSDEKAIEWQWAVEVSKDADASEEDKKKAFKILNDNKDQFQSSPNSKKSNANIPDIPVD